MPAVTPEQFRRIVRRVRSKIGLPRGVRVRWILDEGLDRAYNGMCTQLGPLRFEVSISPEISASHCHDIVAHEAAHIRQFLLHPNESSEHGPAFGVEWARVWSAIVGDA